MRSGGGLISPPVFNYTNTINRNTKGHYTMPFNNSELRNIASNTSKLVQMELADNFHKRKCDSLLLADSYSRLGLQKKAHRVKSCSTFLQYRIDLNRLNEPYHQRLCKAYFCSDRLCPICQWRKARKTTNQLTLIMKHLLEYRFIFLTLTIQNVRCDELQPAVDNILGKAWHNLINNRRFKNAYCGFFRSFEITHDVEPVITKSMFIKKRRFYERHRLRVNDINPTFDTYHPHIHAIVAVTPDYFEKRNPSYLGKKEVRNLWRNALHIAYNPYVDFRVLLDRKKENDGISSSYAILNIAKYITKSADYLIRGEDKTINEDFTDEAVSVISAGIAKRRLISYGGIFRKVHKSLNLDTVDDGDLLFTDAETKESLADFITIDCTWRGKKGYIPEIQFKERS